MEVNYTTATVCELELMDYLFYTARDFGRLAVTEERVISNYSLVYALGRAMAGNTVFPKSRMQRLPTYTADFSALPVYVTPAVSAYAWTKTRTYNTIPERYQERQHEQYGRTFPSYGRYTMVGPESCYVFVVFSELPDLRLPSYLRLGKFLAPARLTELARWDVRRSGSGKFVGVPVHQNDVPINVMPIPCNLINLGKGHAVLTDTQWEGKCWQLPKSSVRTTKGQKVFIGQGLPVYVRFCVRGEFP
jgi:CRISPR type I-D-associated protein Csc1